MALSSIMNTPTIHVCTIGGDTLQKGVISFLISQIRCKHNAVLLAFFWCLGLISGLCICSVAGDSNSALIRAAASVHVSFIGIFTAQIVSVLLLRLIFLCRWQVFLDVFILIRAMLTGIYMQLCVFAFGGGAWLAYSLLFFSSMAVNVVILFLSLKWCSVRTQPCLKTWIGSVAPVFLICIIDHAYISPFLLSLMEQL